MPYVLRFQLRKTLETSQKRREPKIVSAHISNHDDTVLGDIVAI